MFRGERLTSDPFGRGGGSPPSRADGHQTTERSGSSPEEITKTRLLVYELKVADVMTTQVLSAHPSDRMSSLRETLRRNRISGLPVVVDGRLHGLISLEDFITWLAERQEDCAIEERMTRDPVTLFADDPLVHVIARFETSGYGRFPVLDRASGKIVGILTKGDVIEGLLKKLEIDYQEEQTRHLSARPVIKDLDADTTVLMFQYDVKGQDFKHAGAGSSRLKKALKRLGIRPEIARRIAIAAYEGEMNLTVFTTGGTMRARVYPSRVLLEIRDSGPGIDDIEKAMRPGYSTAPDWVRDLGFGAGMGLCNIQKSSDDFAIESEPGKGTLLKLSFITGADK